MKKVKIKIVSFLIILGVFAGCEGFLDVNTDPNTPSSVSENLTLAPSISGAAYVFGGWWQILGSIWSQHWTQSTGASQYRDFEDYQLTPSNFDRAWSSIYAESLNDLEQLRISSMEEGSLNYYMVATLTQCWVFQMMTDCFDQIPFTEALKGDKGITNPNYDNGSDVYDSLLGRIDAVLALDRSSSTLGIPGNEDLLFSGDMDSWVAFANTLKLKIYLRQVYARPTIAQAGVESLLSSGTVFLSEDAAMTAFVNEENRRNPAYETGVDRLSGNIAASATIGEYLLGDPRRDILANTPANGGEHVFLTQGDYRNSDYLNIADLSTPSLAYDDPVYFFSEAEVYFLLAEAELRYGSAANAKAFYDAGVTAAFAKLGLDASSYIAADGKYAYVTTGDVETDLEQIITQKWVSMANAQGVEAWLEFNRTGYPDILTPSANNVTSDVMPKRFLWSANERSGNSNVPALKAVTDAVWWDK